MSTEVSPNAKGQPAQAAGTKPAAPEKMSRESVTIISTLLVATFVVILNETIMNVALQRLMVDLQVDAPTVQWLSTGFMLTMAVVIPTTGFILQSLSTRAVFMLAMGLFAGGTALAAVAPGFEILLLARIVQAGGTAIMLPLLMTTILTLVPLAKRGAVMGNVSIAISVAPAMGPTVSGLILEHFTWRFMFVFVLPVALAALAIGAKYLTNIGETEKTKLDFLSVFLTVPAFGGLVYGLSQIGGGHGGQAGPSAGAIAALVIGVAALAVFVMRQVRLQKASAPLLDLGAFNFRMFTVSVLLMVVAMMALFGGVILLPLYLQEVRGLGSLETGLALLPGGLAMGLLGPVIGRPVRQGGAAAADRHGVHPDGGDAVAVLHARRRHGGCVDRHLARGAEFRPCPAVHARVHHRPEPAAAAPVLARLGDHEHHAAGCRCRRHSTAGVHLLRGQRDVGTRRRDERRLHDGDRHRLRRRRTFRDDAQDRRCWPGSRPRALVVQRLRVSKPRRVSTRSTTSGLTWVSRRRNRSVP
ncbi:MFS family permease [Arthrobacter sp. SORGH_AS 212]|nr:MFS family permease [Arthrobacter sp. SORGH_AS_0212]